MTQPLNLHSGTNILANAPGMGAVLAAGTELPATNAVGFAVGCLFIEVGVGVKSKTATGWQLVEPVQSVNNVEIVNAGAGGVPVIQSSGETNAELRIKASGTGDLFLQAGLATSIVADGATSFVGMGTAAPWERLVIGDGAGDENLTIYSSGRGEIFFANDSTGSGRYRGYFDYRHGVDEMHWGTAGISRGIIDTGFHVRNATTNPSAHSNHGCMFAKDVSGTVELFAQDDAGNATQLTQHASDGPDAIYQSPATGRGIEWVSRRHIPVNGIRGDRFPTTTIGVDGVTVADRVFDGAVVWSNPMTGVEILESADEYEARTSSPFGDRFDWNRPAERQQKLDDYKRAVDAELAKPWFARSFPEDPEIKSVSNHVLGE